MFACDPRFHAAYEISPLSLSLLPTWDITVLERKVYVSAPGYISKNFTVEGCASPIGDRVGADVKGAYLHTQLKLVPVGQE